MQPFSFSNFKPEKLKKDDKAILLTVLASKTPITFFHFVQLSYFLGELANQANGLLLNQHNNERKKRKVW